ncbi:unnamed protein product [Amoebophrya sp. A25]|nr:unnamed protein product [Amoebophrya sp. A25]|eukprot:GSA25T00001390001.1
MRRCLCSKCLRYAAVVVPFGIIALKRERRDLDLQIDAKGDFKPIDDAAKQGDSDHDGDADEVSSAEPVGGVSLVQLKEETNAGHDAATSRLLSWSPPGHLGTHAQNTAELLRMSQPGRSNMMKQNQATEALLFNPAARGNPTAQWTEEKKMQNMATQQLLDPSPSPSPRRGDSGPFSEHTLRASEETKYNTICSRWNSQLTQEWVNWWNANAMRVYKRFRPDEPNVDLPEASVDPRPHAPTQPMPPCPVNRIPEVPNFSSEEAADSAAVGMPDEVITYYNHVCSNWIWNSFTQETAEWWEKSAQLVYDKLRESHQAYLLACPPWARGPQSSEPITTLDCNELASLLVPHPACFDLQRSDSGSETSTTVTRRDTASLPASQISAEEPTTSNNLGAQSKQELQSGCIRHIRIRIGFD